MDSFRQSTQITSPRLLLQVFFFILFTQFPLSCHGCHEHERRALLEFKSSLTDPSNRLSSWSQHQNCCHWRGIECSHESFHIVLIDLRNTHYENSIKSTGDYDSSRPPDTSIHGTLSPSLSNITHLEYLDLAFNDFQESQIPFQLSHLTKLTHLDLSNSNFTASISTQFANLTSLVHLDLSCKGDFYYSDLCLELSSIKWLRGSPNLQVLELGGIDLYQASFLEKNFGESISHLSNLRDLDLYSCNISGTTFPIPDFHNLSRLFSLDMSLNDELKFEIPVELANLTSLSILDLYYCNLQGSIPHLPQLTEIGVSNNRDLHPDLTRMFQHQWPKLKALTISFTNLSDQSIPESISNAPLLVSFSAHTSSLVGSLPPSISNLSRLEYLYLSDNNIAGYIPISICELSSLRHLDISNNNITGTIPSCLTKLHGLHYFSASKNSIGGTVSLINYINDLNLTRLDLSSNLLSVVIDQSFHLYSKFKLEYLALPSCNLTGVFPTFICKFTHLRNLDLSQNNLAGVIPSSCFSQLQNFDSFNLSNNKFHGPLPLPPQFGYRSLSSFDLSNNKLSGEISTEIGKRLSSFATINLGGNQLSGPIPFSIFSKDSGVYSYIIDISNNRLSGIIPTSIGYCTALFSLNLGSNNLTGNVPNELEQLKRLQYLQLNDNNLDGAPLNFISKLEDLRVLNLANNHFTGSITTAFGSAFGLSILSLRSNKFNGSIPGEINHLEYLQILDLSGNNLSGHIPKFSGKYWRGEINSSLELEYLISTYNIQLQMVIKGIMVQFEKLYSFSSGIDLSSNMLDGNIPVEIGSLGRLATLNLSHNGFSDDIPPSVGNMSGLGSLDLSFNRLSGHIPQSLTSLDSLGVLNLSYNRLSGRIPRGNHFDTLSVDGWAFVGNDLLCGEPTKKVCDGDKVTTTASTDTSRAKEADEEDDQEYVKETILFYGVIALGFGTGFWGLFFVLLLRKEKWWLSYWEIVDSTAVRITNVVRDI